MHRPITTIAVAALIASALTLHAGPAMAYSGEYPLHWDCGTARADVSPKTGDLTVTLKTGERVVRPFAWFESGKMVVPWECEEQVPCAVGDMQILGDDRPPVLVLYGFKGLPEAVDCRPRR